MAHRASLWTLVPLLICIQVVCPMDREPDKPEDSPFAHYLKNCKKKNTRKPNQERPASVPQAENTLTEHLQNFKAGKTQKKVVQQTVPPTPEAPLAVHTKDFFRVSSRPRYFLQLETPLKPKTELQRKLEVVALRNAVTNNDIHCAQRLLLQHVDPNAVHTRNLKTTLHLAATLGHNEILELLLDHPFIALEATDQDQHPALYYAIREDRPLCISALLHRGAWVGPDVDGYTIFHRAVEDDKLPCILALLLYCINPKIPIPEPLPPIQLPSDNNYAAQDEQHQRDPIEILDEIIEILDPGHATKEENPNFPSLQKLCIQKMLSVHLPACKALRCDILAKLWGRPLAYTLPIEQGELCAEQLDFANACTFIASFAPHDHLKIAAQFAWYYAKEHLKNVSRLLRTASSIGQTPLQAALARGRSAYIQALVNPDHYIVHLNVLLKIIPALTPCLSPDPSQQNPLHLFYFLFMYRLLGGVINVHDPIIKE